MLTYRALESNSEAVACDIAAYLNGGSASFSNPPAGSVCTVNGGANNNASVVIFPFDQSQFNDFRMWRADMETMSELRTRAQTYCPATQPIKAVEKGSAAAAPSSLTPMGSALSIVQSALGLVSSETSISPVAGTIQDQPFMDGVARELRSLNVRVLMPATYVPYSLIPINASRSPLLSSLEKLYQVRECLEDQTSQSTAKASVDKLIADIDSYLAALAGSAAVAAKPVTPTPKATDGNTGTQGPANTAATSSTSPSETPVVPSHLMAVLSADGLAQKLGVDPETGLLPGNGASQHILLLKALESGGTVEKKANILGTKVRYSGGSVGTYVLFTMDGELECSGNVYEYGGSLPAKEFQKGLRNYVLDPSKQYIFQRGSCHVPFTR